GTAGRRGARRAGRARRDHDLQAEGAAAGHRGGLAGRPRPRARGGRTRLGRPPDARRQAPRRAGSLPRVRRPGRGSERLPPPRRAPAGGLRVLDRRPRLDERDRGERPARPAGQARPGRHRHRGLDGHHLFDGAGVNLLGSTSYESVLLALKIAFLVLLYLFIWRIVRTASKEMRLPQESFILRPGALAGGAIGQQIHSGRLVVVASDVLNRGEEFELDSVDMTI